MTREGVLGVLSISGSPGRYSLAIGLTGPKIVDNASPSELLEALADQLRNADGSRVKVKVSS